MGRGFKQYALGPILMLYAQKSLRCLEIFGKGRKKIEPKQEHEKRVILEAIVGLLPREKNALSVSFLSMLLRAAIYLQTTIACRLDLEKRMALQLGQVVLDDLLIPSYSFTGDTSFEFETMQRIMMNFLDHDMEENRLGDEEYNESHSLRDMERVGKLMENYLAEIASDRNLSITSFINLAEVIPEQERTTEDGMYRAIDIYFKLQATWKGKRFVVLWTVKSSLEKLALMLLRMIGSLFRQLCKYFAMSSNVFAMSWTGASL